MSRAQRLASLALWGCVVLLTGLIVGGETIAGGRPNHASVSVVFPDGAVESRCVTFEEERISGAELLRRAGMTVVFSSGGGFGAGVCRIGDVGCSDPGSCYCQCEGGGCAYWAYFSLGDDDAWRYQNVGPSQRQIRDGDADAWVWGSGTGPPADVAVGACDGEDPSTPVDPAPAGTVSTAATDTPAAQAEPARPATRPAEAVALDETTPAVPTPLVSPPADAPQVVGKPDAEPLATDAADVDAAADAGEDDDDGGAPVGLIAFGIVAAALAAGSAGIAVWRRSGG